MPHVLVFSAVELRPIVRWTRDHAPYSFTFGQQLKPEFWKPGVTVEGGCATAEQMDLAKIPPALFLAKDDGIYLMSASRERDVLENGHSRVAFARGFNPKEVDRETLHQRAQIISADDFVEALPLDWFLPVLRDLSLTEVRLELDAAEIRLSYTRHQPRTQV